MRGILLSGGVLGVWVLSDTIANDPAQAVEPAKSCLLGDLLTGAGRILGGPLGCPPSSPTDGVESGGTARDVTARTTGTDRLAAGVQTPRRAPTGGRPAKVQTPVRGTVDSGTSDVGTVVAATTPVTRPVVGLASPVVDTIAETGLLEPVRSVVQPVVEPIVDVLPPALAPVLGLAQPILGPAATPATPPADPAGVTQTPSDGATPGATPATITRPAPAAGTIYRRALSPGPPTRGAPSQQSAGALPSAGWPDDPGRTDGAAPGTRGSPAGNGNTAGGTATPADASPRSWSPELQLFGWLQHDSDKLRDRPQQPGTRPA